MAFVVTWRIAVHWKKDPALIVVPGMRVELEISPLAPLVPIYAKLKYAHGGQRLLNPPEKI